MGHVWTITRSLSPILEKKPCVPSVGHIFSPILIKHGQNVCLIEIANEFENESCWVKNQGTRSYFTKTLYTLLRPRFQSDTLKIANVCLNQIPNKFEN